MLSQNKMIFSSFLFALGWFTVSFTFPLEAGYYNLGSTFTGLLGLAVSIPFPLIAYFYVKYGDRYLYYLLLFSQILIAVLVFLFTIDSRTAFISLVLVTAVLQAVYWVSLEVTIGSVPGERSAEKYSAAWGLPNFITPILAGYLLQYVSFEFIALFSSIILFCSVLFIQKYRIVVTKLKATRLEAKHVFPLFFGGTSVGYFSYVFVPLLRHSGFEYHIIGILGTILGGSMALGFLVFSTVKVDDIKLLNSVSALLMFSIVFLAFSRSLYLIVPVAMLTGFGVAISFSKVLAYIAKSTEPVMGAFYYELFFAMGYGSGSTLGGVLSSHIGYVSAAVISLFPAVYLVYILTNRGPRSYPAA